jgi:hypothetical protein
MNTNKEFVRKFKLYIELGINNNEITQIVELLNSYFYDIKVKKSKDSIKYYNKSFLLASKITYNNYIHIDSGLCNRVKRLYNNDNVYFNNVKTFIMFYLEQKYDKY